jgi:hypothetical protein
MREHPDTEVVLNSGFIDFGDGMKAKLVAVELPDLGQQEEKAAGIRPVNSGIYVVRNGREIMEAQTFGFYQHHHAIRTSVRSLRSTGCWTICSMWT